MEIISIALNGRKSIPMMIFVKVNDEVCLVASNKNDEVSNKKKNNTLSCGAISNIIIDE